jgi:hypothetical protein
MARRNASPLAQHSGCRFDLLRGKTLQDCSRNQRQHVYEVRPRKDKRGVDLISDVLASGTLWYDEPNGVSNAVGYAKFFSYSHPAVIRVFDESGTVIETHEHAGDFQESWVAS